MFAFIAPTAVRPFRPSFSHAICAQRVARGMHVATHSPTMRLPGDEDPSVYEDDDATMGSARTYGIKLPNFSKEDELYLNEAKNREEFVARMSFLAKEKERQRKLHNDTTGAQSADDYLSNLGRSPKDLSDAPFDSTGTTSSDEYIASLNVRQVPDLSGNYESTGLNRGEEYIQQLTKMHEEDHTKEEDDVPVMEPSESTKNTIEKIKGFQSFLRDSAGVKESDLKPEVPVNAKKIENTINELEAQLNKILSEEDRDRESSEPSAEDIEALERKIKEMHRQAQEDFESSEEEPEVAVEDPKVTVDATGKNVDEVDKQIGFLENYLDKLKREEEEERAAASVMSDDDTSREESGMVELQSQFEDSMQALKQKVSQGPKRVGKSPSAARGEMSEAEKMEAFDAIRKQMMKQRGASEFMDPLAASLPDKKMAALGDEEDDNFDIGSAKISDAFFAVSELESEVKKYLFDAKSLLSDHERRMKTLLEKLKELE